MALNLININEEKLHQLFKGKQPFIIAYMRAYCPDSSYVKVNFLSHYQGEGNIYLFDLDSLGLFDYASLKPHPNYQRYLDEWGLSATLNKTFGYRNGHIPTLQYIEPNGKLPVEDINVIKDMIVIYNDVAKEGTSQIAITYFDQSRPLKYVDRHFNLKGITLSRWSRSLLAAYHDIALTNFFNLYLAKTK